jgi:phage baseplate assembly protein W
VVTNWWAVGDSRHAQARRRFASDTDRRFKFDERDADWSFEVDETENPRRRLGLLLIEMGLISEEQLELALNAQERTGELLGEILISRGYVTRLAIQDALATQQGVLLAQDPGFGSGLRRKLVGHEGRSDGPIAAERCGSPSEPPESNDPTAWPADRFVRDMPRPKAEPVAEASRQERRIASLERGLDDVRQALADVLTRPPGGTLALARDGRTSDAPQDPFLAIVGRAQMHISARRAALRKPLAQRTSEAPGLR